jgi:flagella basal body P-ring formation protein FlgA
VRAPVVVAIASIARGATIEAADVTLKVPAASDNASDAFTKLEDVVGKEALRAILSGDMLVHPMVRTPTVVRRGEVVTVYARNAGLEVRAHARAKEDGGQGELIEVESLATRKAFTARVSGPQEVEVAAGTAQAAQASSNRQYR